MLIYHFILFKMQIRNDCNALNIVGYQCKSFISQLRIKSCGMDTPDPTWECFEILLLHVLSNDAWQFTINLFSISWGPLENVNLPFFYWKCKFEMVCNALNIARNTLKCINVNLSFLSFGSKIVEWTPLTQHDNFWNSTFACTVQWCMTIYDKPFSISWGPFENVNLLFFVLKMQIWNPMKNINVYLSFLSLGSKVVEWTPLTQHEKVLKFYFCMYCPMMHDNLP